MIPRRIQLDSLHYFSRKRNRTKTFSDLRCVLQDRCSLIIFSFFFSFLFSSFIFYIEYVRKIFCRRIKDGRGKKNIQRVTFIFGPGSKQSHEFFEILECTRVDTSNFEFINRETFDNFSTWVLTLSISRRFINVMVCIDV